MNNKKKKNYNQLILHRVHYDNEVKTNYINLYIKM